MRGSLSRFCLIATALLPLSAWAGTAVPFTINLSKPVNVVTSGGTPRIAVDVAGTTRYANYTSGSGTSALTFTYNMQAGDVDLDGVAVSSPVQLNGGTIKDLSGNPLTNLTFTPPNTAGVKVNYPSLGMDFTNGAGGRYTLNGTAYNTLASFLTAAGGSFTRASVGTYYDSAGVLQTATANTPRLDYDPVTHAAKGILIEEARTNLLTRSSEFDNAAWGKNATSISANAVTAPDGTSGADMLIPDNASSSHSLAKGVSGALAIPSFSVYVKAAGYSKVALNESAQTGASATFNLTAMTVSTQYTGGTATITDVGGGWRRIVWMPNTSYASPQNFRIIPLDNAYVNQNPNTYAYTGNGTSGIYVWGAQLEQGAFPTSYIPTTTAAVTRQADSLIIPTGSWYNQSAGAFFNDVSWQSVAAASGWPMFFRVDDTTSNNRWNAIYNQTNNSVGVDAYASGAGLGSFSRAASVSGSMKIAAGQAANNANAAFNGVLDTNDTSWTPPTVTRLNLNDDGGGSAAKWYKKVKYYPARVPDTLLQLMTQ